MIPTLLTNYDFISHISKNNNNLNTLYLIEILELILSIKR
jgi:hypothetical protein